MTDAHDEKAQEIWDASYDRMEHRGLRELIADALRDAVAAERERCARVAETYVVGKPAAYRPDHRKPKSPSLTRQAIANAIRNGD